MTHFEAALASSSEAPPPHVWLTRYLWRASIVPAPSRSAISSVWALGKAGPCEYCLHAHMMHCIIKLLTRNVQSEPKHSEHDYEAMLIMMSEGQAHL